MGIGWTRRDRISLSCYVICRHMRKPFAPRNENRDSRWRLLPVFFEGIVKRILFPESWEKYSCEELDFASREEGGTLWDASAAIAKFALAKSVEEYTKPVDKEKWGQSPQVVNCFYNPQTNSIYIMGAFARGGMYRSDMSDVEFRFSLRPHAVARCRAHRIRRNPADSEAEKDAASLALILRIVWVQNRVRCPISCFVMARNRVGGKHPVLRDPKAQKQPLLFRGCFFRYSSLQVLVPGPGA